MSAHPQPGGKSFVGRGFSRDRNTAVAAQGLPPLTDLRALLAAGVAHLEYGAAPSAPLAAELLLMHALGRDRAWLYAHPEYELNAEEAGGYAQLLERRAAGVPMQHLTGRQEFWALDFEVTPSVLIPRPETEHLIEVALDRLGTRRPSANNDPLLVADVGTGSGCIAIALAKELPHARIIATDISAAALDVARRNAQRHGVASRIRFLETNLLDFSSLLPASEFDLMVSNPPYIGLRDAATLPREVRDHEPPEALFAGEEGFQFYAPLIAQARSVLGPNGFLVLEIGYNGATHVRSLLETPDWSEVAVTPDLAGIPRIISAKRRA